MNKYQRLISAVYGLRCRRCNGSGAIILHPWDNKQECPACLGDGMISNYHEDEIWRLLEGDRA